MCTLLEYLTEWLFCCAFFSYIKCCVPQRRLHLLLSFPHLVSFYIHLVLLLPLLLNLPSDYIANLEEDICKNDKMQFHDYFLGNFILGALLRALNSPQKEAMMYP